MARADLLYRLVQSGMSDGKSTFRKVVEAIISEERARHRTVLADKLNELLTSLPADVVGTFLGETAGRLKKVFEQASTQRCVLFFDEFETLGKERGDVHETGELKCVVSSLLMQIDSLPSHVVVIGAANHAELLDRTVWRRFQIRMILPSPTEASLAEWFERFERRINIFLGYTPAVLAKSLIGANFAETEEFGAAVLRQYVLGQPDADMKDVVSQNIRNWTARTVSMTQHDELEMKA